MSTLRLFIIGLAIVSIVFNVTLVQAEAPQNDALLKVSKLEAGIAEAYRVGSYTPLTVQLFAGSTPVAGELRIQTVDGDDSPVFWPLGAINLAAGEQCTLSTTIQVGRQPWRFKLQLFAAGQTGRATPLWSVDWTALNQLQGFPSSKELYLEVGPSIDLTQLANQARQADGAKPEVLRMASQQDLPTDSQAYDAISGVIWNVDLNAEQPPQPAQIQALAEYVKRGGNLLLLMSYGPQVKSTAGQLWQPLLPGQWSDQVHPLRQYTLWQNLITTDQPLQITEQLQREPTLVPVILQPRGEVLLSESGVPLITTWDHGLGSMTLCLADLNRTPFNTWQGNGRQTLLKRILPWSMDDNIDSQTNWSQQTMRLGYDDLAGQFRAALTQFPEQQRTSIWWIIGVGFAWMCCWYPLQAFLLPSHWGSVLRWGILLSGVLLFSAISWWSTASLAPNSASSTAVVPGTPSRSTDLLLRSVELIDIDQSSGLMQGTSFAAVTANQPQQVQIQATLRHATSDSNLRLGWLGLPGNGWGGLDTNLAAPTFQGQGYHLTAENNLVQQLVLARGMSKTWAAQWHRDQPPQQLVPLWRIPGISLPGGTIRYQGPVPLQQAVLLYGDFACDLGTLQPNQEMNIELFHSRGVSIGSALTGRRFVTGKATENYDRSQTDLRLIMKLLLFHRAAGGSRYTGLWHRALVRWDQSSELKANDRAVLLGWGPSQVQWQGADTTNDSSATLQPLAASEMNLYRFWIPVTSERDLPKDGSRSATVLELK